MMPPTGGSIHRVQTQNVIPASTTTTATQATIVVNGLTAFVSIGIASIGSARSLAVTAGEANAGPGSARVGTRPGVTTPGARARTAWRRRARPSPGSGESWL